MSYSFALPLFNLEELNSISEGGALVLFVLFGIRGTTSVSFVPALYFRISFSLLISSAS